MSWSPGGQDHDTDIIFRWGRHPEGEILVTELLDLCRRAIPPFKTLAEEIASRTGTRILDWIDHFVLADGAALRQRLAKLGFEPDAAADAGGSWIHPGAIFPRLLLTGPADMGAGRFARSRWASSAWRFPGGVAHQRPDRGHGALTVAPGPDLERRRPGDVRGGAARVLRDRAGGADRRSDGRPAARLRALESPAARIGRCAPRKRGVPAAMERTHALARSLAEELGADEAAWIAFSASATSGSRATAPAARSGPARMLWASAGPITTTTPSAARASLPDSPANAADLRVPHARALPCGAEAGWGAQVLEQPACRLRSSPMWISRGRGAGRFPPGRVGGRDELGTVGLWCALHGESLLEAGLHHLAVRSDFPALTRGWPASGWRCCRPSASSPSAAGLHRGRALGGRSAAQRRDRCRDQRRDRQRFAAEGAIEATWRTSNGVKASRVQPGRRERYHPPHRSARRGA